MQKITSHEEQLQLSSPPLPLLLLRLSYPFVVDDSVIFYSVIRWVQSKTKADSFHVFGSLVEEDKLWETDEIEWKAPLLTRLHPVERLSALGKPRIQREFTAICPCNNLHPPPPPWPRLAQKGGGFILNRLPWAESVSHLCLSALPARHSTRDRQEKMGKTPTQRKHLDNIHHK